jgi:hypothetical protein
MEWELSAVHGHPGVDVAAMSAARAAAAKEGAGV